MPYRCRPGHRPFPTAARLGPLLRLTLVAYARGVRHGTSRDSARLRSAAPGLPALRTAARTFLFPRARPPGAGDPARPPVYFFAGAEPCFAMIWSLIFSYVAPGTIFFWTS